MTEKNLVAITNQTFAEAGGSREYPQLEMGQTVMVVTNESQYTHTSLLEKANELLSNVAGKNGYTHLFAVEYKFGNFNCRPPSYGEDLKAIATGYRPKQ